MTEHSSYKEDYMNSIKCHHLEDEKGIVICVYAEGGRTLICNCLGALVFSDQCTSKEMYHKLWDHVYTQHVIKNKPSDIRLNEIISYRIDSISPRMREKISEFVTSIHPKVQLSKLQAVPCDALKELKLEGCPLGYKPNIVRT
jgi:hypothetical protein